MSAAFRAAGSGAAADTSVSAAEACSAQPSPLPAAWDRLLDRPFAREPHRTTLSRAEAEAAAHTVYPPRQDWFTALRLTPPEAVRAVILGQDPYHGPGQAMGLAFSVPSGTKLPPSLRNMYRELSEDLDCPPPDSGDLTFWADQGVLLLNTVLTVEAGKANSHKALGWEAFTGEVLAALLRLPQPIAFVLWGAQAQGMFERASAAAGQKSEDGRRTGALIGETSGSRLAGGPRLILSSVHPSPLSAYRGFFGSRPYSKINTFLRENGQSEIRWTVPGNSSVIQRRNQTT